MLNNIGWIAVLRYFQQYLNLQYSTSFLMLTLFLILKEFNLDSSLTTTCSTCLFIESAWFSNCCITFYVITQIIWTLYNNKL